MAPAGGDITPSEREQWCRRAARACTEGHLTLGAYADLVGVLQESADPDAFRQAAAEVRAAGASTAMVPAAPGAPMVAILAGDHRKGAVQLAESTTALAVMGGIELDLREATVSGPVTVIQGLAFMGGVEIRVPPGIRIDARCLPILGGCDVKLRGRPPRQDAPVIRLQLALVMAGVNVRDGDGGDFGAPLLTETQLRLQQSRIEARAAARAARRAARHARREGRL